jgi:phosphocarrier protein FPr
VAAAVLGVEASSEVTGAGVVVAAELTPAEAATLQPETAWAVATAGGGATSHAAILARALGIPAVVGLGNELLEIEEGTLVAVDGDAGTLQVDPPPAAVAEIERRRSALRRRSELAQREAELPALTRDGTRVEVAANLGAGEEAEAAVAAGADAVGLLRTEFLFLDRQQPPDEEEQEAVYRSIATALDGRPLTLRTLDVGGDKPLPYLPLPAEANPFLGLRGIRVGLAQPDLLLTQLRAALRVATDHPLRIMFPMVATVGELLEARRLLQEAATEVGVDPGKVEVGVMVEVPGAALAAAHLARHADFLSIGTNDLTQYTLAAERGNPRVAALADPLHPAVLSLIATTAEAGSRHGRWVGVCGELAGDPKVAALLLGLGVGELSVAVPAVGLVKQAVRAVDGEAARRLAQQALTAPSAEAVRQLLDA